MAVADIKIRYPLDEVVSINRIVASGAAASINNGEPTKQGTSGAVAIMVDGDGTTTQLFTGIAKTVSTDTAAAAGAVETFLPLPGIIYSAKAKVSTNANTVALIQALQGKRVVFDLTGTAWTIDTAAGDASTNCVVIIGGEYQTSSIHFIYGSSGSLIGA